MSRNWKGAALLALALMASGTAIGSAKKLPKADLTTEKGVAKAVKTLGFTSEGKVKTFPKKVAIPYFQIRYSFQAPVSNSKANDTYTVYTLQLADDDYTRLTDMLYSDFEHALKAEGIEVVPKETMLAAAAYQALDGEEGEKEGGKRARYAPSGFKNIPTLNGQPKKEGKLAALNTELGTDAAVAVYANIGICDVASAKMSMFGIKPCLRGTLTVPGFSMLFVGGAKGTGEETKPEWTYRSYKEFTMWDYGDDSFDAALFSNATAMASHRERWWKGKQWDAQSQAFIEGGGELFDKASQLAFAVFDDDAEKARAAAGVVKPASVPDEIVPDAAAEPISRATDGAPRLSYVTFPGVESCWAGPVVIHAGGNDLTGYENVIRRGYDAATNTILEDSILIAPDGKGTRYITKFTLAGAVATGEELGKTFTNVTTFVGEPGAWTGWHSDVTIPTANMTATVEATLTADALTITTANTMNAKEAGGTSQALKPLAMDACKAKLEAFPGPLTGFGTP